MNLVHIASGDLWAGAEKQLYTLLCELLKHDVSLSAIVLNPGELADRLIAAGVDTLVLDESRDSFFALLTKVRKFLRTRNADIVHTHRIKENILGALCAKTTGAKTVCTRHGSQEHCIEKLDLRRQFLYHLNQIVDRYIHGNIIVVAEHMLEETVSATIKDKLVLIPNGIPLPADTKSKFPRGEKCVIGIVGRLVPVKRIDVFIETAKLLMDSVGSRGVVEFRIVGDGPLREEMEQLVTERRLQDSVEFLGHVSNAEEEISKLDILLICSDHEGLPMVALEAMVAGTLVVANTVGGLGSLLSDGCGYSIESQEPASFLQAIIEIISDPETATRATAMARQKIERGFSSTRMVEKYLGVYKSVREH